MSEAEFYPSRRMTKRGSDYFSYLNLWPFAGVLIVLLVIFMVVTGPPFAGHGGGSPDRPLVRNGVPMPLAIREDAIKVAVTRDGSLYFANSRVSADEIAGNIRESINAGAEKRVYLVVDKRARYSDVKQALGGVQAAGIEKVAFLVEAKRNWQNESAQASVGPAARESM